MQKNENLAKEVQARLARLSTKGLMGVEKGKPTLEAVTVIQSDGSRLYMERIIGTTKYLAHNRKVIYDVSFLNLYNYNLRIPAGCIAIKDWLMKIDGYAHIEHPSSFLKLLDKPAPKVRGTRFYLDNKLYAENVPFGKADAIRNDLLQQRNDGIMWFEVLTIIDPSGNETKFYPSKKALKAHKHPITAEIHP